MLGPIGLAAGVIAAIVVALKGFHSSSNTATSDANAFGDALANTYINSLNGATDSHAKLQTAMDSLTAKQNDSVYITQTMAATGLSWKQVVDALTDAEIRLYQAQLAGDAATQAGISTTSDVAAANDKVTTSVWAMRDADKGLSDANQAVTDAQGKEADAQKKLSDLLAAGVDGDKQVISAKQAVTRALQSQQDALDGLAKAQTKATALELADANLKIAEAGDKIVSAQQAQGDAQEKLNALVGSGAASADEIAAAQQAVVAAAHAVTQAQIDQGKSAQDLVTLRQKGTAQDPAVIAAQRNLATAKDSVTTATQNELAAEQAWRDKVVQAQADVASAHQTVLDKLYALPKAQYDAATAADAFATALAAEGVNLTTVNTELGKYPGLLGAALDAEAKRGIGGSATGGSAGSLSSWMDRPPGRAAGGPTEPYGTYLVGEHGPELLRMGAMAGTVIPNGAGGGSVDSHDIHVTATTTSGASSQQLARDIAWSLMTVLPPHVPGR